MSKPAATHEAQRRVATAVVRRLRGAGHEAYFVGGCVREMLLGREPADFDVTTDALPDRIAELFPRVIEVGKRFGVITVLDDGVQVEVATYRTEGSYSDGRRPDEVTFADAQGDVSRRDFTINALLYDPLEDRLLDLVGGQADLQQRVLRTVGDPRERFGEDKLRMLRAVRFTARLELSLDVETRAALGELAHEVGVVSAERVRDELARMLEHPSRAAAFRLLDSTGLLRHVLPEIEACRGVEQPPQFHPEGDVLVHTMLVLEMAPAEMSEAAAWALLLHDIGKPGTQTRDASDGRIRFHGHDVLGADMADVVAQRLKFSNALRERVVTLVRHHLLPRDAPRMRTSTLRRLLSQEWCDELIVVARADAMGGSGEVSHIDVMEERRIVLGAELPPPLVSGRDLHAAGLPPGPRYAVLLEALRDEQLEGKLATREEALARLAELLGESE